LRCYQCSGSDCIDVASRPQYLLPCPVYQEDDRCYTNVVHLSNTLRGCEHTNLPTTCPHVCLKCNYNYIGILAYSQEHYISIGHFFNNFLFTCCTIIPSTRVSAELIGRSNCLGQIQMRFLYSFRSMFIRDLCAFPSSTNWTW